MSGDGTMRQVKNASAGLMLIALALLLPISGLAMRGPGRVPPGHNLPGGIIPLSPAPITVDQVIQNVGNIATTVDNTGYIGGYRYYNLPSGEWPRNSGHNYIGEVKYWMGGVAPNGDTLVANTFDDIEGMSNRMPSETQDYKILLSTDSTRYPQEFDRQDTVGLGLGNPAYGWRVWDQALSDWAYNQNYSTRDSLFHPGGPTSLQQSFYKSNDSGGVSTAHSYPMGLVITHRMMQWNYCYNQDFTYVILEIKNTSILDYSNFAFGLYIDLDIGGFDGTGENGRLGDSVGYDIAKNLAWNLQVSPKFDPGWGPLVKPGFFGVKLLETPDNIGLTGLRTGEWEFVPTDANADDIARYTLISESAYDTPLSPADQYFIMCTNGINLTAGKTIRIVYALVAGENEATFKDNADRAQFLYDKHYVGPQPPATPTLSARAGDKKVYLHWDDAAEQGIDPLSGQKDFTGYKLYRSDNQGKSWGTPIYVTGNSCLTLDYETIGLWEMQDSTDVMPHSYIDAGLDNGVDYWYCLAAYDHGDASVPVDVLQSGFGVAGVSTNVVSATPLKNPAGYFSAAGTIQHLFSGVGLPSIGTVTPILFNRKDMKGPKYAVTFRDAPEWTYWYLLDLTNGDTVLADQTDENIEPDHLGFVDGLRLAVTNADITPTGYSQTAFAGAETTLVSDPGWTPPMAFNALLYGQTFNNGPYRQTYELRYTTDSSLSPNMVDPDLTMYKVPYEVWNTTTNTRVSLVVRDGTLGGVWRKYNSLTIVNCPYSKVDSLFDLSYPYDFAWYFKFDTSRYNPAVGDRFTIVGPRLNGPGDRFEFTVDGVDPKSASASMANIKVVPDPYIAQYSPMIETGQGQSIIEFQNVPDVCTIRIYTLAGDLVQTLQHNALTGTARWNLLSSGQQQIASGVYIYHVDSPYGTKLGRFSVIK